MGILETGLKAVVAVKAADVIHKRVLDRQAAHAAAQGSDAPAPATPAAPATDAASAPPDMAVKLQQLQQLGQLKDAGVLTDAEFETQKTHILGS